MKEISGMTIDEMESEMKEYVDEKFFDKDEKYVFISYSHKDREKIYPTVLEWMRAGYNIYLDLDFENHSSDANWVDLMQKRIQSNSCELVVCFYSENYCFSYPAMIELLTIRSNETIKKRESSNSPKVPVDIIELDNKPNKEGKNFSSQEVKDKYKGYFEDLKKNIGEVLWNNNTKEEKVCRVGLETLYEDEENIREKVEESIAQLKESYIEGMSNFYPDVALIIAKWRKKNDLNGNTKSLKAFNAQSRFDGDIHIFKREKDIAANLIVTEVAAVESELSADVNVTMPEQVSVPIQDEILQVEKETDAISMTSQLLGECEEGMLYYAGAFGKDNGLGGIILYKGSRLSRTEVLSCPDSARKKRAEALSGGEIFDDGVNYVLNRDIEFKSWSAAACFVSGTSVNGKLAWKTEKKEKQRTGGSVKDNGEVSAKINQICMVIEKIQEEPQPIVNYTKTLQNIYTAVALELAIGKSSVVDKCQRQLGLSAMEFAKHVRDYMLNQDETLYQLILNEAGNKAEQDLIRKTFRKEM